MKKLLLILLMCSWCFGATIYVNATGGDDTRTAETAGNPATPLETIEEAIEKASDGDTISVAAGQYAGPDGSSNAETSYGVQLNAVDCTGKDLTVVASAGAATTFIEGTVSALFMTDVDLAAAATIEFQDFTFRHSDADEDGGADDTIRYDTSNLSVVFTDCVIVTPDDDLNYHVVNMFDRGNESGSLTFTDCTCTVDAYSDGFVKVWANCVADLTISGGTYTLTNTGGSDAEGDLINHLGAATSSITVSDTTIVGGALIAVYMGADAASVTLNGNTATNLQKSFLDSNAGVTTVKIYDNTIGGTTANNLVYLADMSGATGGTTFQAWDNTCTELYGGIKLKDYYDYVYIAGNDMTLDQSATADGCFIIGYDDKDGATEAILEYQVINNTVEYTGGGTGHCILGGADIEGGEIAYNDFTGGNYQYVIKGVGISVHDNLAYGANCYSLYGATDCVLYNNTAYATSGFAFRFNTNATDRDPSRNRVYNNIFDASGGADYAVDAREGAGGDISSTYSMWFDYNCYYGGTNVFMYNGTGYDTIAALIAGETWADIEGDNMDSSSVVDDPLFISVTNKNFGVKTGSPCMNTGYPAKESGKSTIGAWQPDNNLTGFYMMGN